jgi:hypothetical protein
MKRRGQLTDKKRTGKGKKKTCRITTDQGIGGLVEPKRLHRRLFPSRRGNPDEP